MTFQKQYVRRRLEGYRSPYEDAFEYRSVADVGEGSVVQLMGPFHEADSWIEWREMVEADFYEADLTKWLVAFLDGVPFGVVFPAKYSDRADEGTIVFIAVLPEHQGNGYGKILHAKGLERLSEQGITKYAGSTEASNTAMLGVFRANGCEFTRLRTIQVDELGRHIPVD
jgi:ribosomal protein S18 acetylase RimI-like enzyme